MPVYSYACACGHYFEDILPIKRRKEATCPSCTTGAVNQRITAARIDYIKMGMDPAFPTAYAKWGDSATKRMSGLTKDSNNSNLKCHDVDRTTYDAKKKG